MALQVALLVSSAFSVQKDGKVNASSSSFKDSSLFGASITEHGSSSLRFKREHSSRSVLAVRAQTAATSSPSVTKSSSGGKKTLRKGNVVVTGASSGLGLATAKALAETGKWHVIMACRDFLKAERAAKSAGMPKDSYTVMHLDLASLDSVRQFVDSFRRSEMPLDVLVCNAAVYFPTAKEPTYSAEGFELSVATNHLGHFLLSRLLLDDLKKSDYPSKRLIIVGSITGNTNTLAGNVPPKANLGDLRGLAGGLNGLNSSAMIDGGDFDGAKAYKDSKVCNMLTMQELHRRYHEETGVTFASLYPGCIASTGLFREHIPLFRTLFPPFQKYITKGYVSETESGKRLAQVVSDPSLTKSGVYWSWNKASASFENELSEEASDVEKARKVWEISEKLVGTLPPMEGSFLISDAQQAHEEVKQKPNLITGPAGSQANESGCFDCNICLDTALDPVVTLCGHLFCWPCIYKWLHVQLSSLSTDHHRRNNCPVCKSNIAITSLVPLYGRGMSSSVNSKEQDSESTVIPRRPAPSTTLNNPIASEPSLNQTMSPTFHSHRYSPRGFTTTESTDLANAVMMSLLYPVIGMFGDMVYTRVFGTFTNAIAQPYQSQRMMQTDKSLNRVSIFFLCCIILCLLLF
ncbi:hypothetical protein IGI04_013296 [Brassica rapa subsp. trilocularis]|uniref:NADPH-protochlorophyllide oxidoreductase n=1 Tax=Brassica rapa subsp. trilocularis TaxID=1813537 RepID=A0ABQ7N8F0_BRACM|nr:hypothetical protein IGI04_013296 [Brassica rapa subsp. trilocularis]